jgi:hypothetical protein
MRAWKSADRARRLPRTAAAALALLVSSAAVAELTVTELNARLAETTLELRGEVEITLMPRVEEALSKGIELPLRFELKLKRERRFLWDPTVAAWVFDRRIRYHALSNQYLVSEGGGEVAGAVTVESYGSLANALKALGSLDLRLALPQPPAPQPHRVELRVSLDIESLPAPLRPVAYTSSAWHLNSGWTTWPVAR